MQRQQPGGPAVLAKHSSQYSGRYPNIPRGKPKVAESRSRKGNEHTLEHWRVPMAYKKYLYEKNTSTFSQTTEGITNVLKKIML